MVCLCRTFAAHLAGPDLAKADIWSLGLTMLVLLTGNHPWRCAAPTIDKRYASWVEATSRRAPSLRATASEPSSAVASPTLRSESLATRLVRPATLDAVAPRVDFRPVSVASATAPLLDTVTVTTVTSTDQRDGLTSDSTDNGAGAGDALLRTSGGGLRDWSTPGLPSVGAEAASGSRRFLSTRDRDGGTTSAPRSASVSASGKQLEALYQVEHLRRLTASTGTLPPLTASLGSLPVALPVSTANLNTSTRSDTGATSRLPMTRSAATTGSSPAAILIAAPLSVAMTPSAASVHILPLIASMLHPDPARRPSLDAILESLSLAASE